MRALGRGTVGAALLVATAGVARSVHAQTITGSVVLPDSATPARGVIVLALDARGTEVARGLTGSAGRFQLRAPATGRYRLRVLRIGYRPTEGPTVDAGIGTTDVARIVLSARQVVLSAMNVRDRQTCRVSADTGYAVAQVWDEARKAMLSTQLTSDDAPLVAEWIEYDRGLDSAARLVREQHVRVVTHPTTHAFKSRPVDELAKSGYVVSDGGATTYFAPDAEVLLSDLFAASHCFRLTSPPAGQSQLIGIAFEPSRDRSDARDIGGTLWLDRSSAELRTLEFHYTNLPDLAMATNAGGHVEFLRLDDGNWLVRRWNVRMPVVAPRDRAADAITRRVVMAPSNLALRGVQTTGGEVTRVTRHDTVVYRAAGPHVAVQVVARDTLVGASGGRLTLEGTDYAASADPGGRIFVDPVLAGRYRARVSTPLMDSLGVPPVVREVEAREDARVDTVTLPPSRDLLRAACPADSIRHGEALLRGRVRDERARPAEGAAVTATWQENFEFIGAREGQRLGLTERTIGVIADSAGQWRLCGVPREREVIVRVATDSGSDRQRVRLEADQALTSLDLVLHREVAALNREAKTALGENVPRTALVEIAVSELGGGPIADATVEVVSRGRTRSVVTGPTGRALIPEVLPGQLVVRARRIGYEPGQFAVTVEAGRNTVPIVLGHNIPPTLDTVRVIGDQRLIGLRRNDEFDTRRINHQATVSITHDDIVKRNPVSLWQMLLNIPSVKVVDSLSSVLVMSTRTVVTSILNQGPCWMSIAVDGVIVNNDPLHQAYDLRQLPAPDEVHGIEVFAGASNIPVQYGGTGNGKWCGMIAIWTR
ncbi:MAG TPA: carboxypeptidase-like regulatory domain-containing protein [Gemmatimonadaceae bacterium]|nr:carboxypeptidase-like regulatory domain-containing protein [Gemmatimonadaceae bacterium]